MIKSTLQQIGKHSFIYSINYVMSSLVGILLLPVYTRYLSKTDYGTLSLIDQSLYYLKVIFFLGGAAAVTRFYHHYESDLDKKLVIGTGLWFALCSSVAGGMIIFYYSKPIAAIIFGTSDLYRMMYLAAVILISESLISVSMSYFAAAKKSAKYVSYGLLQLGLGICLNLYFIVKLQLGAMGMIYGQAATNMLLCIVTTAHVVSLTTIKFDTAKIKSMVSFGLPLVPATILAAIMHNADQYQIRYFDGLADVGVYSLGYKIAFAANSIFMVSVGLIWSSAMIFEIQKRPDAKELFARITTYLMSVLILLMFLVSMFSEQVVSLLAAPEYIDAHKVIPLVCLGLIPYGMTTFMSVGVTISNKTWFLPLVNGIAAVLNIAMNILFIPAFGYMGAAVATVITYFVYAAIARSLFRRVYDIPFEWRRLTLITTTCILLYLASTVLRIPNFFMQTVYQVALCLAVPIILHFLNFYNKDERSQLYELYQAARRAV